MSKNNNNTNDMVDMDLTPGLIDNFVDFVYERMPEAFKDDKLTKKEQALNYMDMINNSKK